MKRTLILLALTAVILCAVGCSRKEASVYRDADYIVHRYEGNVLNYEDTTYKGTGFNPERPSVAFLNGEAESLPAYRSTAALDDMFEKVQKVSSDTGLLSAHFTDAERKLVKSANVSIRVENLAAADDSITGLLKKFNAYAASARIEENSRNYSLRVPEQYYDIFLAEMNGMGRLLNRYESTEDVTLRYYDLEGRLATKKELLKTFQSYLGKAKNIEEILSVEARLSELQYDIEGTGIQLRNLANQIDYATIDLRLYGPVTSAPGREITFTERVKQLFGGFGGFLSTVAMVIIGIVIYGIPVLLLLGLLFLLFFGRIGLAKKLWNLIKSKR